MMNGVGLMDNEINEPLDCDFGSGGLLDEGEERVLRRFMR